MNGINESISEELCAALERFNAKVELMGLQMDWTCDPYRPRVARFSSDGAKLQCGMERWLDIGGGGPLMPAEPGTALDGYWADVELASIGRRLDVLTSTCRRAIPEVAHSDRPRD